MKKLKNYIAPIKIFMSVIFSMLLGILTIAALIPITYIYNFDMSTSQLIYVGVTSVYFISTISYLFDFRLIYDRYKFNCKNV
tara:strand:- start:412 stop:657 length:246 start_codon:yes stop_codon:yes gene_type:complete